MHWLTRLACTAPALIAQAPTTTRVWAQAVTPAPAAEPLIPDWIWMTAIVIAVIAAIWYFLRTRRG